jgi:hypothetical protein
MSRQDVIDRLRKIEGEEARKSAAGVAGTVQVGHNNNVKYNTEFYGHPVEGPEWMWCVVFQWWCMKEAGVPKSVFPEFRPPRVFNVRDWFKSKNRYFQRPMVGDLVIFSKSHIGFVDKLLQGGRIETIEGNASDMVMRHTYHQDAQGIDGYCRPEYHKAEEADMTPSQATELKAILNRVNDIREALNVEGTHTLDEGFQMLFNRVRTIEAAVKDIQARIN